MAWYAVILKEVGAKVGEKAAKELLTRYGGEDGKAIAAFIFGEERDYSEQLNRMEQKLDTIQKTVQTHYEFSLLSDYNREHAALVRLISVYRYSEEGTQARRNACANILAGSTGAFGVVGSMVETLLNPQTDSKNIFQKYASHLREKNLDAITYYETLRALADHLRLNILLTGVIRELAAVDDSKVRQKDSPFSAAYMKEQVEDRLADVLRPSEYLVSLLKDISQRKLNVRVKHRQTEKFLTAFANGSKHTVHEPFGTYDSYEGSPQIFLMERLREVAKKQWIHRRRTSSASNPVIIDKHDVEIFPGAQLWQMTIVPDPDDKDKKTLILAPSPLQAVADSLRGMTITDSSGKKVSIPEPAIPHILLDGAHDNTVYFNKGELDNTYMRWIPMLDAETDKLNSAGPKLSFFKLIHRNSEYALAEYQLRVNASKKISESRQDQIWEIITD